MLRPFDLHAPDSVKDASSLLKEGGEAATAYAGGTELLLVMKAGFVHYESLVDVKGLDELRGIRFDSDSGTLIIGAAATHREIEQSPVVRERLPAIAAMERTVANVRVRNQGTIGGNLCFAEPHSDPATLFLALGASVVVGGDQGRRTVPLPEFILDAYTTSLNKGEILIEVRIPPLPPRAGVAYRKFGIHERPTVGVAAVVVLDQAGVVAEARIAVGCVGPRAVRFPDAERLVAGSGEGQYDDRIRDAAASASAAIDAVGDLHGSAEYKRHLVGVFVRRALVEARQRAAGRHTGP